MAGTNGKRKRSLFTILACNLFFTLTVAFFSPLEVLVANIGEFMLPFHNIWWFQLLVAVGAALVLTLVMYLLPPRAGQIAAALTLGLGLAAYIQAMFLNGAMVNLTGEKMKITEGEITWNLVIWGAILLAVLLAVIIGGIRHYKGTGLAMRWLACALTAMQAVAFVSLVLTTDTTYKDTNNSLSVEGQFELSKGQNAIEFVFDTADGMYVHTLLEEYPELKDTLSGWTWYPNATSVHSRTYPSICYMLTGQVCHFDLPADEYIDQAYANSNYLRGLHDSGTDVRLYTFDPEMVADSSQEYVSNCSGYRYSLFENLELPKLEENLMKVALYKSAPYRFKNNFSYSMYRINMTSFKNEDDSYREYNYMDPDFYYDLTETAPMTVTDRYDKAFRFYHTWGVHPGADWDENLNGVEETEDTEDTVYRTHVLRGSFRILESYIQQMKDLGIYDDALIIVTADHGIAGRGGDGESPEKQSAACVMMLVKYPHSDLSQPLQVNKAPVSHADIFATVEAELGAENGGYGSGRALNDFTEGEERERLYYHSVLRSDEEGEIFLREYQVDGDAEDFANWHKTGNWWDILYSYNAVSGEPYDGGDI